MSLLSPHDRRELAQLGLIVLAVGLVAGPLVHVTQVHAAPAHHHSESDEAAWTRHEGPRHAHGERSHPRHEHTHPPGSLEHLGAVALPALAVLPPPEPVAEAVRDGEARASHRPVAVLPAVMPQGP